MIRQAGGKDFDKIMRLWEETNSRAHYFIDRGYWQKNKDFVRNTCLPESQTFVFIDHHRIKGFISLLDDNYIGACFVGERFQKQKIGQKLIRCLQRRRNTLRLHVYAKNHRAVAFYRRQGFKIISQSTQDETGQLQLLMGWSLGCPPDRMTRIAEDS